jgi:hypothetical protein
MARIDHDHGFCRGRLRFLVLLGLRHLTESLPRDLNRCLEIRSIGRRKLDDETRVIVAVAFFAGRPQEPGRAAKVYDDSRLTRCELPKSIGGDEAGFLVWSVRRSATFRIELKICLW